MSSQDKTQVSVHLPRETVDYIDAIASRYGVKRPAAISILVQEHAYQKKIISLIDKVSGAAEGSTDVESEPSTRITCSYCGAPATQFAVGGSFGPNACCDNPECVELFERWEENVESVEDLLSERESAEEDVLG